jgi:glycosyltransferase involved in cell wall biosynthesis
VKELELVTVLTPVFDGAAHIRECLDSLLRQTYANWHCIVVDNASSDGTPDIIEKYSARDSRIRLARYEDFVDSTANHNRAFAMLPAESEYCKVLQADDWLYPECLAEMVSAANRSESVGLVSSYQLFNGHVHLDGLPHDLTIATGRNILRTTLLGLNVTGGPTATLLRSAFVLERKPFWESGFRHEDTEAYLWMLSRHDFAFVHQVLSFARYQPEARLRWSDRMNSRVPEDIVFLIRYGPSVLTEAEYRAALRAKLRSYLRWHLRQLPRPSRLRDRAFFEFHNEKRRQILAEADGDREVTYLMAIIGALLLRGGNRGSGADLRRLSRNLYQFLAQVGH